MECILAEGHVVTRFAAEHAFRDGRSLLFVMGNPRLSAMVGLPTTTDRQYALQRVPQRDLHTGVSCCGGGPARFGRHLETGSSSGRYGPAARAPPSTTISVPLIHD